MTDVLLWKRGDLDTETYTHRKQCEDMWTRWPSDRSDACKAKECQGLVAHTEARRSKEEFFSRAVPESMALKTPWF